VRRITDYGAFIDLGGVDGLLHITEMSWTRIRHPSDALKTGQKLEVMILKYDRESQRISLGLKQILPDPWQQVTTTYRTGQIVTGTVTRVVPFGAFVQLPEGIEAIIPNSECGISRSARAQDVLKEGDEIQAKVLSMRPAERRMTLSLRQVQQDQERREYRDFVRKQQASSRVTVGDLVGHQLAAARTADASEEEEEELQFEEATEPADEGAEQEQPEAAAEETAESSEPTAEETAAPETGESPEPTAEAETELAAEVSAPAESETEAAAPEAEPAEQPETADQPEEQSWSSSESPEESPAESPPSDDFSRPEGPSA
jgi:predicted RNA-binding protein with RPS1 domain